MYQIKITKDYDGVKEEAVLDEQGEIVTPEVLKTEEEIEAELQLLIENKTQEIQAKVDAYEAAKENQRKNGGPGPVAQFEIMKICNNHNCEFEVIFRED